jgi:hypothetical protein
VTSGAAVTAARSMTVHTTHHAGKHDKKRPKSGAQHVYFCDNRNRAHDQRNLDICYQDTPFGHVVNGKITLKH